MKTYERDGQTFHYPDCDCWICLYRRAKKDRRYQRKFDLYEDSAICDWHETDGDHIYYHFGRTADEEGDGFFK